MGDHGVPSSVRAKPKRRTHRTARVIYAVGSLPSPRSNADIMKAAGIKDAGQASKLLSRLESDGLIYRRRRGRAKGQPNSWNLTRSGLTEFMLARSEIHPMP